MQVDFLLTKHSNHLRYVLLLIITPTYYILGQDKEAEHFFFRYWLLSQRSLFTFFFTRNY